jgi:MFS family permease
LTPSRLDPRDFFTAGGWWLWVAACACSAAALSLWLHDFFLAAYSRLGLSRAATSLVFSLARAEGAVKGPSAGYLIDRFGPRPMMLAGVILSGVRYMLLAGVEAIMQYSSANNS